MPEKHRKHDVVAIGVEDVDTGQLNRHGDGRGVVAGERLGPVRDAERPRAGEQGLERGALGLAERFLRQTPPEFMRQGRGFGRRRRHEGGLGFAMRWRRLTRE